MYGREIEAALEKYEEELKDLPNYPSTQFSLGSLSRDREILHMSVSCLISGLNDKPGSPLIHLRVPVQSSKVESAIPLAKALLLRRLLRIADQLAADLLDESQ